MTPGKTEKMFASDRGLTANAGSRIPEWVQKHRMIFAKKKALRYYYHEIFASLLKKHLLPGPTLEIGSGPGFLSDIVEDLITSDYENLPGFHFVCDAHELLFPDQNFKCLFRGRPASFKISFTMLPGNLTGASAWRAASHDRTIYNAPVKNCLQIHSPRGLLHAGRCLE